MDYLSNWEVPLANGQKLEFRRSVCNFTPAKDGFMNE